MSRLFPIKTPVERESGEPRLVDIDEDAADEVFSALASETARTILATLYDDPATASEVAERADTSLQNARYHLQKLVDADLVAVVDTWYSERGTEMKVYAPASDSVVVFAGEAEDRGTLRTVLAEFLGAAALLAVASLLVQRLVDLFGTPLGWRGAPTGAPGAGAATTTTTTVEGGGGATTTAVEATQTHTTEISTTVAQTQTGATPTPATTHTTTVAAGGGRDLVGTLPPGALFFLGGLFVLVALLTYSRLR